MKTLNRILILIAALAGLFICITGVKSGLYMLENIEDWEGGVNFEGTITWLFITLVGAGFTGLASLLAFFGLAYGPKGRKRAFWLLVLPGILGIIIAGAAFGLLVAYYPHWENFGWYVLAAFGIPALIFMTTGIGFRKANPKKKIA